LNGYRNPVEQQQTLLAGYLAVLAADGHQIDAAAAELRSGQFHDVVLAGDVAYRFPRDAESRRALPARVALLAALAAHQPPAAIPVPFDAGHLDRPLGSCYVALRRLAGDPAEAAALDSPQAEDAIVAQLADLLDRLARLGSDPAVQRAVPQASADEWTDWAGQVGTILFPLMSDAGRRRAEAELTAVCAVTSGGTALVHTDLGGANVLLTTTDGLPRLAGILDWDGAWIGNQANDLASLAVTFGWETAQRIDGHRRSPGGPLYASARIIADTFALQQALPAALSGDVENLDDGLTGYR
jgi:aminoglycoside phosphotransferase (APT) family kinase protein